MQSSDLVHSVAARCAAPAHVAFSVLADASRLGEWALGCWDATAVADDVVRGRSLLDGADTFVRVVADETRLAVDYELGADRDSLVRRIHARAIPGDAIDLGSEHCLLVLLAWRPATMSDERWRQLTTTHAVEVLILRRYAETEVASA